MFSKHDSQNQQETKAGGKSAHQTGPRFKNLHETGEPRRAGADAIRERLAATGLTRPDARDDVAGKIIEIKFVGSFPVKAHLLTKHRGNSLSGRFYV